MCRCRFQKDSEREKQLSYPNTYIWNLEKWCWRTYLQGRNRDTAIEDRLLDTAGEGEGGTNWESSTETYTLPCGRQLTGGAVQHRELNTVVLDNLEGWDVAAAGERSRGRGHIDTYDWRMLSCGRQKPIQCCGLPWWLRWERICLQCRRSRLNPWVRNIPWRREWLSTPIFLPGEFHGHRSLGGYSPWGCKVLDTTEWLTHFNSIT